MAKFYFRGMNAHISLVCSLAKGTDLPVDIQLLKIPEAEHTHRRMWAKSRDDLFPPIRLGTFSFHQTS